jgi:hypothetical protein
MNLSGCLREADCLAQVRVGRLATNGVVERAGDQYHLTIDPSFFSPEGREELVQLCDSAITSYLQKRGAAVYDHRRAALGYLSGSLPCEVLKASRISLRAMWHFCR